MLKLLYKTLLVSVLSGSLLLLDFSYKGAMINSAMAESVKTEKINDSDLMGTLTMTVVGVLAQRMYTYKPTVDIMLAAAGGAIFLAGEVLAFVGLKDVLKGMEEQITRDKAGNVNKEQIESIERLKKTYEEAKKTANQKKMLQMAAAAAFAAAAVAAYTMAAGDLAALSTCTAGIGTGLGLSKAVAAICQGYASNPASAAKAPPCYAELAACTASITTYQQSVMSYEMGRQSIGPSIPLLTKAVATEATLGVQLNTIPVVCLTDSKIMAVPVKACNLLVPNNVKGESSGRLLVEANAAVTYKALPAIYKRMFANETEFIELAKKGQSNSPQKSSDGMLSKITDFIFPQANAALFSAMGIASSLAISFILATSATIGPAIDMYMLIPQHRAIVWGILSALTFAATTSTNNVIAQIDSNIKKIDEILKAMYSMADGATGTQIAATTASPQIQSSLKPAINGAANAVNYEAVDLSKAVNGTLPCGTGEEGQKCKPFEDTVKDLPSYEGLNAESQLQLSSIMKTADGLSGTSTISAGALNNASKLAGQSNALKSAMDKARAATAAALKKSGSGFNIDAESKKLSDQMEKAVNDNLKKSGTTANGMAANLQGGRGFSGLAAANTSASDAAAKKAEADALAAALARAKGGAGANAININSGSSEKMDLGLTGVDNGSTGKMTAEELAAYNESAKKAAGNIDDYDIKNDISKDTGANLFELISNRYQQSGYPRLFKLKEAQPDPVQAVKK
ncbi:hypothetical protein SHI21_12085 [Bacteriovorax sp. PP10]|uniref:Uncharacterized protein n=1 Tax=Bacteriovorax antarcticus TaxID=3088717 RepID=A0ABU5VXA8_9BACT|nr:hypothetical protein [Bacteriovorax sp. PP10]MEA9356954.1 hypothetical protein [Bacteriovorax sp. PP10]